MKLLLALWVFLLPLQTRWIVSQGRLAGGLWEYGTFSIYATDLLLLAVFFAWLIQKRPGGHVPRDLLIGATLFLAAIGFSAFNAGDVGVALNAFSRFVLGYLAFRMIVSQKHSVLVFAFALLFSALIQTVFAWTQFASQSVPASTLFGMAAHAPSVLGDSVVETGEGRFLRPYGTLPHPNILAAWLVMGLVVAAAWFFRAEEQRARLASLAAVLVLSSGLILTFSRAALLSWFLVLFSLAVLAFVRGWKAHTAVFKICLASLFLFLALRAALLPLLATRATLSGRLETQSVASRVAQLSDARRLVPNAWFLGLGVGNYTRAVYEFVDSGRESWKYQPVHNVWLLAFLELGVFGFSLLLWLVWSVGKRMLVALWHAVRLNHFAPLPMQVFSSLSLFALFIMSMFDHFLWSLPFGISLSWAVAGLFLAAQNED